MTKEFQEFPVRVTTTLEKQFELPIDSYSEIIDDSAEVPTAIIDTKNVNWEQEYKANCLSIFDLLSELRQYVFNELKHDISEERVNYLNRLLDASLGWKESNIIVDEI